MRRAADFSYDPFSASHAYVVKIINGIAGDIKHYTPIVTASHGAYEGSCLRQMANIIAGARKDIDLLNSEQHVIENAIDLIEDMEALTGSGNTTPAQMTRIEVLSTLQNLQRVLSAPRAEDD